MKIGDKVRFLNEIGGGTIAGFQDKNIVLVEDSDGFQIPTRINDVVVVEQDNSTPTNKVNTKRKESEQHSKSSIISSNRNNIHNDYSESSITFRSKPYERKNGDALSLFLAFVPIDIQEFTNSHFEIFLINDSNYYINFIFLSAEGKAWRIRDWGCIEPNTKMFIEELGRNVLNEMESLSVQGIAYKRDKTFILKTPINQQLCLDTVKFYKLHTFQDNIFFDKKALIYTLIENDQPIRNMITNTQKLKENFYKDSSPIVKFDGSKMFSHISKMDPSSNLFDNNPIIVDLQASKLLNTTKCLSSTDILNYQLDIFHKTLTEYSSKIGCKIIFIQGKGSSVLRKIIIHEMKYRYKTCRFQDVSFQEYSYGAIQVTIE